MEYLPLVVGISCLLQKPPTGTTVNISAKGETFSGNGGAGWQESIHVTLAGWFQAGCTSLGQQANQLNRLIHFRFQIPQNEKQEVK